MSDPKSGAQRTWRAASYETTDRPASPAQGRTARRRRPPSRMRLDLRILSALRRF